MVIKLALNVSVMGAFYAISDTLTLSEENKEPPKGFDSRVTRLHLYFIKTTLEAVSMQNELPGSRPVRR